MADLPLPAISVAEYVYWSSVGMLLTAVVTFVACMLIKTPYGRYTDRAWGILQNPRFAWAWQESPSWWVPLVVFAHYLANQAPTGQEDPAFSSASAFKDALRTGLGRLPLSAIFLLVFFEVHYIQRAVIYPLCRMSPKATPVPLTISVLAFLFCIWNGLQQSLALLYLSGQSTGSQFDLTPRFRFGFTVACVGMFLNIHADSVLMNLRSGGGNPASKAGGTSEVDASSGSKVEPLLGGDGLKKGGDEGTSSDMSSEINAAQGGAVAVRGRSKNAAEQDVGKPGGRNRSRSTSSSGGKHKGRNKTPQSQNKSKASKSKTEDTEQMRDEDLGLGTSSTTSSFKQSKYRIPYGGLFKYVSAANLSAEILEWTGFAVAAWSLPSFAFAVYTFANIGPRGWHHHNWYLQHFGENYAKLNRKAVIPFVW